MLKKLFNIFKHFIFCSSCKQDEQNEQNEQKNVKPNNLYTTYFNIHVDDTLLFYFKEQLEQNEFTLKAQEIYNSYNYDPDCPSSIICLSLSLFRSIDDKKDYILATMKLFLYDYYKTMVLIIACMLFICGEPFLKVH